MAGRSTDEVRRELESEREHLGDAVRVLRKQASTVRRRLPLIVVGAAGAGLVLGTAAKRVFRRKSSGSEKRARSSFRDRD